eukprot:CAMPEP_0114508860 /NCGR_PEP_ID=MMETSP0109-20121206/12862_1 /TAXON_ID=29199 /ORGANISM="Chlorarachnion reptans, Strain CCCM449" /LENGTH=79 /DNA_ID=CAMNT_0001687895 /DNA_START=720 /DNA_END=959 /DNA_ORIENTATION=-
MVGQQPLEASNPADKCSLQAGGCQQRQIEEGPKPNSEHRSDADPENRANPSEPRGCESPEQGLCAPTVGHRAGGAGRGE